MATCYERRKDYEDESHGIVEGLQDEDLRDDSERREVLEGAGSGRSAAAGHVEQKEKKEVLSLAVHSEDGVWEAWEVEAVAFKEASAVGPNRVPCPSQCGTLTESSSSDLRAPKSISAASSHLSSSSLPAAMAEAIPEDAAPEMPYQPKDALGAAITGTAITGTAGLFVSTIQNSLARQNVGIMGIFWRTGGTITTFGAYLCSLGEYFAYRMDGPMEGRGGMEDMRNTSQLALTYLTAPQRPWEAPTNSANPPPQTYDKKTTR